MKIAAVLLVFTVFAHAQFENRSEAMPVDTLATVGTTVINATDFLERFELLPWPRKDQPALKEAVKLEFLRSMVAEKLLSMEATSLNLGNDSESVMMQRNFERLFVRDEYYKQEVLPKITITDAERKEGMQRFPYQISVEVLAVVSKAEADLLKKRVSQNKNKSSVFERYKDSLFVPVDTLEVKYGSVEKMIEDAVYSIGKDSLSRPIITEFGMVMFRLLKRESEPQNIKLSQPDRLHKIENVVRQRREDRIAKKAFADVTSPQRAEADPAIFYMLADSVVSILRLDSLSYATNRSYKFPSSAINLLVKGFASDLTKSFITIASGNMTLSDVLEGLRNNNILFPSLNPEHIRIVLNNNIKTVIQNELLSREGLRQNLHQSKQVRHDLAVWMDSRKNWLLSRAIMDTVVVTDAEIESEYLVHSQLYGAVLAVKLKEILVDSIAQSMQIRKRLANGESFALLAKQFSKRKEWASNGGESPWFIITEQGTLGQYAAVADTGQIIGPKPVNGGYTLFSVIGKKIIDDSVHSNFMQKKSNVAQKLISQKQQSALNIYIGTLAKKYNVTITETALKEVKTATTNMVTWRNIGFGGRIPAVPQMFRQAAWVDEWKKQSQLNQ